MAGQRAPHPAPIVAEQHYIERRLAGLAVGESTVVNGIVCTIVSLQTVNLLERDRAVSAQCRRLSATAATSADFDALLCVQDELAMCRCQLVAAGTVRDLEAMADEPPQIWGPDDDE